MSLGDYQQSGALAVSASFHALVMAAMRRADTDNYRRLARAFPEIAAELETRYNAPGGRTPAEAAMDDFETRRTR
jgi:hypothetical protein